MLGADDNQLKFKIALKFSEKIIAKISTVSVNGTSSLGHAALIIYDNNIHWKE